MNTKAQAVILPVTGEARELHPANGSDFSLAELRAAVGGGYIEIVNLASGELLVCDEEGALKGLPVNEAATVLYHQAGGLPYWPIRGDALVRDTRMIR